MIDLHCHLLWAIDDGCQSLPETLEMARELVANGVTGVGVTPHLRHDFQWINVRPGIHAKVAELREALAAEGVKLEIQPGCEHYLTPELFDHVGRGEHTFYAAGPYMLVEVPYTGAPPDLAGVLFRLRCQQITPVLAHVERYARVGVDIKALKKLHEQGNLMQVNLGSLTGAYGKDVQKQAMKVLDAGLAHVVAGDCHAATDVEPLVGQGLVALRKHVGATAARLLSEVNPRAILRGAGVEDMPS